MADITLTIDDAHVSRVLDAFASRYKYETNKLEGETKAQFAKRMLAEWIKLTTLREERRVARDAAEDTVEEVDAT